MSILPTNVLLWLAPPGVTPCNFTPRGWIGGDWVSTELARRDAADTLNAADWQAYLSRKGIFRTRHAWPACEPVAVSVGFPNWASGCELVLDDVDHGVRHRSVINKWRSPLVQVPVPFPHEAFVAQFGRLSTADRSLKLHCAIQYHLNKSLLYDPPDTDVKFQIEIPITIVPALHDAIAPAAGPEYDEIMRRALKPACYDGERRKDGRTRFKLSFSRSADERLRSIAYGFQVDVLCNGSLIETIALPPPYPNLNQNDQSNWAYLNEMRLEVIDSLAHRPKYTFRVSGDSVLGLRDWDRTHYWAGTLEYNLHDLIRVE